MIIGITGTLGAGKGTIVEFLLKRDFKHYSVSGFISEDIVRRGMPVNRDSMILVGNDLRAKFGPGYIVEELYKKALANGGNAVIESIRCLGEIDALKNKDDFVLLSIDADIEARYSRIRERAGPKDNVTFDEFVSREQLEKKSNDPTKQNIQACMEIADYNINNNWTREELDSKVEKILDGIKNKKNAFPGNVSKRIGVLSWDDYFMSVAMLSAQRSKDPSTQVGACIVDSNKKIVGVGYNGFPIGCSDDELPWAREGDFLDVKYPYVCHAELNAILNSVGKNLWGSSIYVALFPCNECAKAIIQSGIKEVVYLSDKYADTDSTKASKKMLKMSGVVCRQIVPEIKSLTVSLTFGKE